MGECLLSCRVSFEGTPEEMRDNITTALKKGACDNRWYPPYTSTCGSGYVFCDLTKYGLDAQYNSQAIHETAGIKMQKFNDTVNIVVYKKFVKVFSTSEISGALGDAGQNYKNIACLMKTIDSKLE